MRNIEKIQQDMTKLRDLRYNIYNVEEYPEDGLTRAAEIQNLRINTIRNILNMVNKDSAKTYAGNIILSMNPFKGVNPLKDSYVSNVDYNMVQAECYLKLEACLVATFESKTYEEAAQKGKDYYNKVAEKERNNSCDLYIGVAQNIAKQDGHNLEDKHL